LVSDVHDDGIAKLRTEIDGFDLIADGGLPRGRSTLVSGASGSARTVFAASATSRPGRARASPDAA
jgi:circadian clock protein KaiC